MPAALLFQNFLVLSRRVLLLQFIIGKFMGLQNALGHNESDPEAQSENCE